MGAECMARCAHLTSLARKHCRPYRERMHAFWNCPNPRDANGSEPRLVSCSSKRICQSSA